MASTLLASRPRVARETDTRRPRILKAGSREFSRLLVDGCQCGCYRPPVPILLDQNPSHPPLRIDVSAVGSPSLEHPAISEDCCVPINAAHLNLIAIAFKLARLACSDTLEHLGNRCHMTVGLDLEHVVAKQSL